MRILMIVLLSIMLAGCFKLFSARLTDPDRCILEAESATNLKLECGSDEDIATEVVTVDPT